MNYVPHTEDELLRMYETAGLSKETLFSDIPEKARLLEPLPLPAPVDEMGLFKHMTGLAKENTPAGELLCFLGGGVYDHFIPAAATHLASIPAFLTAYTPYQPEVSQGTLTAIFEYQTMISELTALDVSNASLYDGASAAAEAMLLATSSKRRSKVIIPAALHFESKRTIRTYASFRGIEIEEASYDKTGRMTESLKKMIDSSTAAVFVQSPNFFGVIEDMAEVAEIAKAAGAIPVAVCDPLSLGILKPPGELGFDVSVGDLQPLGLPMSFGGPSAGYMAVSDAFTRKMPGRIVGETTDTCGRRAFVLTLQAREQHIRRERATSNICSNQANAALTALIHTVLLGKEGLYEAGSLCAKNADSLRKKLIETGKFVPLFENAPFFREFALRYLGDVRTLDGKLRERGILGGLILEDFYPELKGGYLIAATEKRTSSDIESYAKEVEAL